MQRTGQTGEGASAALNVQTLIKVDKGLSGPRLTHCGVKGACVRLCHSPEHIPP